MARPRSIIRHFGFIFGPILAILLVPDGPAIAASADRFDLVCAGEIKVAMFAKWRPEDTRYRIDLAAKRWCQGECNGTNDINSVTDTKIVLIATDDDDDDGPYNSLWIDRVSGALSGLSTTPTVGFAVGGYEQLRGQCTVAAFSGFPEVKRAF